MATVYKLTVPSGESATVRCRLYCQEVAPPNCAIGVEFDEIFELRIKEADEFYSEVSDQVFFSDRQMIL